MREEKQARGRARQQTEADTLTDRPDRQQHTETKKRAKTRSWPENTDRRSKLL